MANTLESLSGTTKVAAHNSSVDLVDKSPLQAFQAASFSQIVDLGRIRMNEVGLDDNTDPITTGNLNKEILIFGGAARTKGLPNAAGIISSLGLENDNEVAEFLIINNGSGSLTLTKGAGTTAQGPNSTADSNLIVANGKVGKFIIRRTASDAITIYRVNNEA